MANPARPAVIVDVDGTLCDVSGIRHYVTAEPHRRNFDAFHGASALCPPIPSTIAWVDGRRASGHAILIVTARRQRWEYLTRRWLRKWGVQHERLYMRGDRDDRRDDVVKRDLLHTIRADGYDVVAAIDDNPSVIELWRAENIPVTTVLGWWD